MDLHELMDFPSTGALISFKHILDTARDINGNSGLFLSINKKLNIHIVTFIVLNSSVATINSKNGDEDSVLGVLLRQHIYDCKYFNAVLKVLVRGGLDFTHQNHLGVFTEKNIKILNNYSINVWKKILSSGLYVDFTSKDVAIKYNVSSLMKAVNLNLSKKIVLCETIKGNYSLRVSHPLVSRLFIIENGLAKPVVQIKLSNKTK